MQEKIPNLRIFVEYSDTTYSGREIPAESEDYANKSSKWTLCMKKRIEPTNTEEEKKGGA